MSSVTTEPSGIVAISFHYLLRCSLIQGLRQILLRKATKAIGATFLQTS